MTLVMIKNKEVVSLPTLWRTALKSIYDPKSLKLCEQREMEMAIINWSNHLELKRDTGFTAVDEEHQMMLEIIGSELKKDVDGQLEERKEQFRRWGIDYKKFYRLPEAYTSQDFLRGQEVLEEHKKISPEDYK